MQIEPSDFRGLLTSLAGQYSLSKSEKWGTVMLLGFLFCVVPAWMAGGIFLKANFGTSELVAFLKLPLALGIALCAAIPGVLFILEHISSIWTISADGIGKKSIFSRFSWTIQSESIAEFPYSISI